MKNFIFYSYFTNKLFLFQKRNFYAGIDINIIVFGIGIYLYLNFKKIKNDIQNK